MTNRAFFHASISPLLPIALCLAAVSCRRGGEPASAAPSAAEVVARNTARVKVLLLGMKGCPGTAAATPVLEQYSSKCPDGVLVARVDVPLPGKAAPPAPTGLAPTLTVAVDTNRTLADALEFFFYPTLYVLDADGVVRYQGQWEDADVPGMVAEILAEKPGQPGKTYSTPLVAVGNAVTPPDGTGLDGTPLPFSALKGKRLTLLLFGRTTCPFSVDAAAALPGLAADFADQGLTAAVVNFGQPADDVRALYTAKAPGIPVLVDADRSISKDLFGVTGAPFFYLLDADGRVVARAPFTVAAARSAVAGALGGKPTEPVAPEGAG